MSDFPVVRLEKDGDIGVITVNYPPVNALGPGVAEASWTAWHGQHRSRDQGDRADGRRPQLHRRRGHSCLRHRSSAAAAGPAHLRRARCQREAGGRRDPRLCARWRAGDRHGLPLSHRAAEREGRIAGSADRHSAGRRRHAAPAAPDRRQGRARHDRLRPPCAGARSTALGIMDELLPENADLRDSAIAYACDHGHPSAAARARSRR